MSAHKKHGMGTRGDRQVRRNEAQKYTCMEPACQEMQRRERVPRLYMGKGEGRLFAGGVECLC